MILRILGACVTASRHTISNLQEKARIERKKKVKGENLFRKNVEVATVKGQSPRYADFLANANRTTQAMFFGGGNAGATRAQQFRNAVKAGKSPQKALIDLTNKTGRGVARRFTPVKD